MLDLLILVGFFLTYFLIIYLVLDSAYRKMK